MLQPELINRVGYHTVNPSFSKDGNTMFFTRAVSDGGNIEENKIYAVTTNRLANIVIRHEERLDAIDGGDAQ